MLDRRNAYEESNSDLKTVFENGELYQDYSYTEVKNIPGYIINSF